jgi:hypothetical protein
MPHVYNNATPYHRRRHYNNPRPQYLEMQTRNWPWSGASDKATEKIEKIHALMDRDAALALTGPTSTDFVVRFGKEAENLAETQFELEIAKATMMEEQPTHRYAGLGQRDYIYILLGQMGITESVFGQYRIDDHANADSGSGRTGKITWVERQPPSNTIWNLFGSSCVRR